jgi:hypothetical protein
MIVRIALLLGVTLVAAPARADLLADAMADDAAVEARVRSLVVQALLGDANATETQVLAFEDLDEERRREGIVRTGSPTTRAIWRPASGSPATAAVARSSTCSTVIRIRSSASWRSTGWRPTTRRPRTSSSPTTRTTGGRRC